MGATQRSPAGRATLQRDVDRAIWFETTVPDLLHGLQLWGGFRSDGGMNFRHKRETSSASNYDHRTEACSDPCGAASGCGIQLRSHEAPHRCYCNRYSVLRRSPLTVGLHLTTVVVTI